MLNNLSDQTTKAEKENLTTFNSTCKTSYIIKLSWNLPKYFHLWISSVFSLASILYQKHQCRLAEESESCKSD